MRSYLTSILLVLSLCAPRGAFAQVWSFETYGKEIERGSSIPAIPDGFGQFGEIIDLNSGSVVFKKTVVELRGSNSLRVAADFEFKMWDRLGYPPAYQWQLATPYIAGIHSAEHGWVVGQLNSLNNQRCSDPLGLGVAYTVRSSKPPKDNYMSDEYWDGNSLVGIEGGGTVRRLNPTEPTLSGANIKWSTSRGWRFSCYTLADGSEGFIGHRPNGEKYYFGIPEAGDEILPITSSHFPNANTWLEVSLYKMHLKRVEDRFGNWVTYEPNRITSSDGRVIDFQWSTTGTAIIKVTADGREWNLSAQSSGFTSGTTVTNPDGSQWSISKSGAINQSYYSGSQCTEQQNIPLGYSGQLAVTVKLESGVSGTFTMKPRRQGYSYVTYDCRNIGPGAPSFVENPGFFDVISIFDRSVQGPGILPLQHTFNYGPYAGCYSPMTGQTAPPNACTSSSPTSRTVTVTASTGDVETHTFGNRVYQNAGLLLAETVGNLQTTTFEYDVSYINSGGTGKRKVYDMDETRVPVVKRRATTLGGRTFVWAIASTCGTGGTQLCIDEFFRPTKVTRSSGP
ncbi:hypothetical protein SAMN06296058_3106 [Pseudoxanthomonas indica]|uniref:YD repeat-containing protein n=2 Tax=Pseudoxanthomonas indica TaxID=428993 RepID=A0A1T5LUY1_9GAMM|nr:hypothetical protein SAMN06296058_3106 [Pseudoxanthomonas indica]